MGQTARKLITGIAGLVLAFAAAAQQPQTNSANSTNPAPGKSPRPLWNELSPKQQTVLAPLAPDWESLDTTRRKKWVTIANRYPKMQPDEQARLQRRMQEWAALTPAQRRVARENYQTLRQLPRPPSGELRQKWDQHKQAPAASPDAPAGTSAGDTTAK